MRVFVHCPRFTLVVRLAALRASLSLAGASSHVLLVKQTPASVSLAAALVKFRVSATTLAPARLVECFLGPLVMSVPCSARQPQRSVPSMSATLGILHQVRPSVASWLAPPMAVIAPVRFGFKALAGQMQVQPNMSVNRTRYGKAPRPRGGFGPSSASRPGRLASARRLPLR